MDAPAELPPHRRRAYGRRLKLGLWLCLAAIAAVVIAAVALDWNMLASVHDFADLIHGWGPWGVAAAIGLMVLHSFVPFPAEFLAMANGMIYGPVWGSVITWTGAMLGAVVAFALARRFGRPFVAGLVAERDWRTFDERVARQGGGAILLARFLPVIAFNLVNYAAGLTGISWWTFLWTTGIGILPLTVLMVMMGDSLDTLPWPVWVALVLAGIALWVLMQRQFARRRDNPQDLP